MSLYYPIPQPTIAANILLRRERRLPVPGEVLVRAGQRVESSDVIAQTTLSSEPIQVDIASHLGMSPAAAAKQLRVEVGTQVEQGTVLAQRGGFGSRISRAPVTGVFIGYDPGTGMGAITPPSEPVSVQAHVKGIVTDLIPYYGATIETPATLIRGIFGLGGEQHGVLRVAVTANDEPIRPDMIDARVTYSIVLGGADTSVESLHRMIQMGARGVITGSMRSSELGKLMGAGSASWRMGNSGWDFPPKPPGGAPLLPPDFVVIVTEGFGSVPMTQRTFELLAAHDGQEVAVEGTTRLRGELARPEIIIPLARTTAVKWLEESGPKLAVGSLVRMLAPDYLGQVAQVVGLPVGPRATQSGVISPVADVQLQGGKRLRVPIANIEVLE